VVQSASEAGIFGLILISFGNFAYSVDGTKTHLSLLYNIKVG
jgi:hypothetical protein